VPGTAKRRRVLLLSAVAVAVTAAAVAATTPVSADRPDLGNDGFAYEGGEVTDTGKVAAADRLTTTSAEVKLLAETHGVSVEEALHIANWMTAAEHAVVKVRKSFPATFAGSEFVHESGAVQLKLWVTGDGRDELALLEQTVPEASFATVSRRNAPLSELTMERTVSSLAAAETGSQTWGSLDFKTGRFKPSDQPSLSEDSNNACIHGTGGWLEGGRLMRIATSTQSHYDVSDGCTPASSWCTTGFTAYMGGKQGILTAGHCIDDFSVGYRNITAMYANGTELFVSLRVHAWDSPPSDDVGFVREVYASADPRGRIYLDQTNGWRNITSLLPYPAPLNSIRCIKSASPADLGTPPDHRKGYRCGFVSESNFCRNLIYCRYTEVTNSGWNDFPRGGSSGGPWFTSGSAAGIHSYSGNDTAVYYRLDWARNALSGLYIYCGGTSQYLCSWP